MRLHLNTVSDLLWDSLKKIMSINEFNCFRLVGGTSLSLQLGHRESVDIDLFTDAEYGSLDFAILENRLKSIFPHIESMETDIIGMGKSFYVGNDKDNLIKLDVFYTDAFVFPMLEVESIRLASIEEIVAMKLEVIGQGGRKKDFWDLHELLEYFSIDEMIEFYAKRYPFNFTRDKIIQQLTDFNTAEDDFLPICYKNKVWEIIKLDIEEEVKKIKPNA